MESATPEISGLPVAGVGQIGSTGDGKHIYFELIFPSGHRDRFNISFSDMDAVVLGLQAALVGVAKEFAGRPEVSSLRCARPELLVNFAVGLATGPGLPPVVALRLNHKSGLQNNLMIVARSGGKTRQGVDRRGRRGSISTIAPQILKIGHCELSRSLPRSPSSIRRRLRSASMQAWLSTMSISSDSNAPLQTSSGSGTDVAFNM